MSYEIVGVSAENLRGYWNTRLPLDRSVSVVVGPNNAGKTSIFKLLNWILNDVDPVALSSSWMLPQDVGDLVLPARDTKHRARRLTLEVAIPDGRMHRKYQCVDGIAYLRMNIRLSPRPTAYLALGDAKRGEQRTSDGAAVELLERVKAATRFVYVPSFRDVASSRFNQTLRGAFLGQLGPKVLHHQQGGAPAEYRRVKGALDTLTKTLEELVAPIWPSMVNNLPPGLAKTGDISLDCELEDLVTFLSERFSLRVSTGEHDSSQVPLTELGSGLQSLLDLAVSRAAAKQKSNENSFLVVEEPESFLHPSAQRVVTRSLLTQGIDKVVLTTHSGVVVDESEYSQVVICKDHHFYFPKDLDHTRQSINSAFLTGQGAEMLFSKSVLFVEGESDRLFFEWLRRRLAVADSSGRMDQLFVVGVGGKKGFGPWIKILESYGSPSDRPISWLVVADGDAATDVRRAFSDSSVAVAQSVLDNLGEVQASRGRSLTDWLKAVRAVNSTASESDVRLALAPVDLEHAALSSASATTLRKLRSQIGGEGVTLEAVLNSLGSIAFNPVADAIKSPWIRGYIGKELPPSEISADVKGIVGRWMQPLFSIQETSSLFSKMR